MALPAGDSRSAIFTIAVAVAASNHLGCTKDKRGATPVETQTRSGDVAPGAATAACGPRGLPPDRHFVAEGLCARIVAYEQGELRGLTFAPNGDLLGVTTAGEIRRYRDLDGDGLFGAR